MTPPHAFSTYSWYDKDLTLESEADVACRPPKQTQQKQAFLSSFVVRGCVGIASSMFHQLCGINSSLGYANALGMLEICIENHRTWQRSKSKVVAKPDQEGLFQSGPVVARAKARTYKYPASVVSHINSSQSKTRSRFQNSEASDYALRYERRDIESIEHRLLDD